MSETLILVRKWNTWYRGFLTLWPLVSAWVTWVPVIKRIKRGKFKKILFRGAKKSAYHKAKKLNSDMKQQGQSAKGG
jgi:hypothetical protein